MFMQVINPPLLDMRTHGHPYISVFANDSSTGARNPEAPAISPGGNGVLDGASPYNDMGQGMAPAPAGMQWPICSSAAPQAPHRPFNSNVNPFNFYRVEFLRVEAEEFQTHWKEW